MSKDITFELNLPGLNAIMKSKEMMAIEDNVLSQVSAQLGDGFRIESAHKIGFISIASVRPMTYKAKLQQNRSDVIQKAFEGVKI